MCESIPQYASVRRNQEHFKGKVVFKGGVGSWMEHENVWVYQDK